MRERMVRLVGQRLPSPCTSGDSSQTAAAHEQVLRSLRSHQAWRAPIGAAHGFAPCDSNAPTSAKYLLAMSADDGLVYTSATGCFDDRRDHVGDLRDRLHVRTRIDRRVRRRTQRVARANSVETIPGMTSVT